MSAAAVPSRSTSPHIAAIQRAARKAVLRVLRDLPGGRVHLSEGGRTHVLGSGPPGGLEARVTVRDPAAFVALLRGSVGFADAYTDGLWDVDDPVALVRIASRWMNTIDGPRATAARIVDPLRRLGAASRNTRRRSRSNVERHYDLGNEFFGLVLDETMGYSCAYWERPEMAPVEASRANLDRVCGLLDLKKGERVLEMGSGWGGLALHAAQRTGCQVSTVTISPNQRDYIEGLARDMGVDDRVEVIVSDYRDVRGTWDKVVSLEMVESVGALHLDAFIRCCRRLMRADGLILLQAITTHDRLFRIERYARTFLNQRIFPGGFTPSIEAILNSSARNTDLRCVGLYDITPSYPLTLRAWRDRLQTNWPRIAALHGFDERFRRMWTLYFAYCEAAFLERRVQDRQLVLAGPAWRGEQRLLTIPQHVSEADRAYVEPRGPGALASGVPADR